MNDPEILRRISNEAIAFDHAHFDDGIDPAPETMVEHHLRLATDRKLITRLQPRFAIALGFFEGYARAIEDSSNEHRPLSRDAVLMDLSRTRDRISSLATFANATEVRDNAAKFVQEAIDRILATVPKDDPKNIGIVVKPKPPPPPPPPVAPPAPNELRTEIDDDLARAAMQFANVDFGNPEFVDDPIRVRFALIRSDLAPWSDVVRGFVGGAQWQLARTENAHVGDEPTMHFPPAFDRMSMPSDSRIVDLICRTIYADRNFSEREVHAINEALDNDAESLRRLIGMYTGSIAEACAVKFAFLHFFSSPNRVSIPSDEEIARFCETWMKESPDDPAGKEIYSWISSAMRAAVAHFIGAANRFANECSDSELTQYETTIAQQKARIEELESHIAIDSPAPLVFRDESERDFWDEQVHALNRRGDRSPSDVAHAADEMVEERRKRMPNRATSNVVQRAMIVSNLLRKQGMHVATVNRIVDGKSRTAIAFGHEQTTLVFVDKPRHDRMSVEDVVDEVVDLYELSRQHVVDSPADSEEIVVLTNRIVDLESTIEWIQKRLAKMLGREDLPLVGESLDAIEIAIAPKEYDDELLSEAAIYANEVCEFKPDRTDLQNAKSAMNGNAVFELRWSNAVRSYVNGAIRKARKT